MRTPVRKLEATETDLDYYVIYSNLKWLWIREEKEQVEEAESTS